MEEKQEIHTLSQWRDFRASDVAKTDQRFLDMLKVETLRMASCNYITSNNEIVGDGSHVTLVVTLLDFSRVHHTTS